MRAISTRTWKCDRIKSPSGKIFGSWLVHKGTHGLLCFLLSRKGCGEHVEDAEMKQVLLFHSCYPDSAKAERPGVELPFVIIHLGPALLQVCCGSESWILIVSLATLPGVGQPWGV